MYYIATDSECTIVYYEQPIDRTVICKCEVDVQMCDDTRNNLRGINNNFITLLNNRVNNRLPSALLPIYGNF